MSDPCFALLRTVPKFGLGSLRSTLYSLQYCITLQITCSKISYPSSSSSSSSSSHTFLEFLPLYIPNSQHFAFQLSIKTPTKSMGFSICLFSFNPRNTRSSSSRRIWNQGNGAHACEQTLNMVYSSLTPESRELLLLCLHTMLEGADILTAVRSGHNSQDYDQPF